VDRSIQSAADFITTDVIGTFVLARPPGATPQFVRFGVRLCAHRAQRQTDTQTRAIRIRPARRVPTGWPSLLGDYNVVSRASSNYGPNQFPKVIFSSPT
jgi:hypothetical protein